MIEVDNKKVLNLFANLSSKKQTKVYKQALTKATNILVKETRNELKKGVKNINTVHTSSSGKYSLSRGIQRKVWKNGEGATVTILGDYRLKFFENGTKIRKTRKGYNRGTIKAQHFFDRAKQNKAKDIQKQLNDLITNSINKIAKK